MSSPVMPIRLLGCSTISLSEYMQALFCLRSPLIVKSLPGERPRIGRNTTKTLFLQVYGVLAGIPSGYSVAHASLYLIITPHYNSYVGEVGIWTGIWALSSSSLQTIAYPRGTVALAAVSPLFIYFLIRKVHIVDLVMLYFF